ncbi:hypothetical protein PBI_CAMILLE_6 [Microbacterium phage Camille]|nr:hypothetical protein PBI_CAMILLE_6 [Microbacterium phage Camille]
MVAKRDSGTPAPRRRRPATTPEAREQQLGSYAYDLAEKQLLDGTASAQVQLHFIKANSIREQLELERLRKENLLTEAKIASAGQADRMEALLTDAMRAFTDYRGGFEEADDDDDY